MYFNHKKSKFAALIGTVYCCFRFQNNIGKIILATVYLVYISCKKVCVLFSSYLLIQLIFQFSPLTRLYSIQIVILCFVKSKLVHSFRNYVFNCSALGSNPGVHYRWTLLDLERDESSILQVHWYSRVE